jgi:hypothetical protein
MTINGDKVTSMNWDSNLNKWYILHNNAKYTIDSSGLCLKVN